MYIVMGNTLSPLPLPHGSLSFLFFSSSLGCSSRAQQSEQPVPSIHQHWDRGCAVHWWWCTPQTRWDTVCISVCFCMYLYNLHVYKPWCQSSLSKPRMLKRGHPSICFYMYSSVFYKLLNLSFPPPLLFPSGCGVSHVIVSWDSRVVSMPGTWDTAAGSITRTTPVNCPWYSRGQPSFIKWAE